MLHKAAALVAAASSSSTPMPTGALTWVRATAWWAVHHDDGDLLTTLLRGDPWCLVRAKPQLVRSPHNAVVVVARPLETVFVLATPQCLPLVVAHVAASNCLRRCSHVQLQLLLTTTVRADSAVGLTALIGLLADLAARGAIMLGLPAPVAASSSGHNNNNNNSTAMWQRCFLDAIRHHAHRVFETAQPHLGDTAALQRHPDWVNAMLRAWMDASGDSTVLCRTAQAMLLFLDCAPRVFEGCLHEAIESLQIHHLRALLQLHVRTLPCLATTALVAPTATTALRARRTVQADVPAAAAQVAVLLQQHHMITWRHADADIDVIAAAQGRDLFTRAAREGWLGVLDAMWRDHPDAIRAAQCDGLRFPAFVAALVRHHLPVLRWLQDKHLVSPMLSSASGTPTTATTTAAASTAATATGARSVLWWLLCRPDDAVAATPDDVWTWLFAFLAALPARGRGFGDTDAARASAVARLVGMAASVRCTHVVRALLHGDLIPTTPQQQAQLADSIARWELHTPRRGMAATTRGMNIIQVAAALGDVGTLRAIKSAQGDTWFMRMALARRTVAPHPQHSDANTLSPHAGLTALQIAVVAQRYDAAAFLWSVGCMAPAQTQQLGLFAARVGWAGAIPLFASWGMDCLWQERDKDAQLLPLHIAIFLVAQAETPYQRCRAKQFLSALQRHLELPTSKAAVCVALAKLPPSLGLQAQWDFVNACSAVHKDAANRWKLRLLSTPATVPDRCCICLDAFHAGTLFTVLLPCRHAVFHDDCIRQALARSHTCPLCRVRVVDTVPFHVPEDHPSARGAAATTTPQW